MSLHSRGPRIALVVLQLAACAGAGAETLDQAWQQALERDHGLKAQQAQTGAAAEAVDAARALALPKVEVGVARLHGSEGVAVSLPGVVIPVAERNLTAWSVQAQMPLYTGGRIAHAVQAAQHGLQSAQAQEQARRQALKFEVAEAFINVLRAERLLAVAIKHQEATAAFVGDAQRLLAPGLVVKAHVLSAQVAHADADQATLQARTALNLARAGYNRLLGRSLTDDVRLDTLASPADAGDLVALTDRAMAGRAELRGLDEAAAAVLRQAAVARGERLPQVALVGGRGGVSQTVLSPSARNFVGVTVNWTLFDPGMRPRHSELQARADALHEQREQLAGLIALQVRQAWLHCEESRQRQDVARAASASAEENLRVVRDRHLQGLATQTEVLAAESQRTRAEGNQANVEFNRVSSALALRLAVGEL